MGFSRKVAKLAKDSRMPPKAVQDVLPIGEWEAHVCGFFEFFGSGSKGFDFLVLPEGKNFGRRIFGVSWI